MNKKILPLFLILLLTGCTDPATIIREETIEVTVKNVERINPVRGGSWWRLDMVGDRASTTMSINGSCKLSENVIGYSIDVNKRLDSNGRIDYIFQPNHDDAKADIMMKYCW